MRRRLPVWFPVWLGPWAAGWMVVLGLLWAAGQFFGVPHVLVGRSGTSWAGSPVWSDCHYLGPFGAVEAQPGRDVAEGCPAFVLLEWKGV